MEDNFAPRQPVSSATADADESRASSQQASQGNAQPAPASFAPPTNIATETQFLPAAPATFMPSANLPMQPNNGHERPGLHHDALAMSWTTRVDRHVQRALDKLAPHQLYRWLGLGFLMALFFLRMFLVQGFYIVAYVLLIFVLNQFILFLQPKDRASLIAARLATTDSDDTNAAPALPTRDDEEFRPFVRRLPEFQFWYSSTVATFLALWATFFQAFDVPVFWPVLVFYFIVLFAVTMRRQWLDMKRLKYVPWDIGSKKTYKSDPKKLSVKPKDPSSMARAALDAHPGTSTAQAPTAAGAPSVQPVPTIKRVPQPMKQALS